LGVGRGTPDAFLTVAEVAEVLKLNQQTVRNWIDQGSLPAIRVGRRVRIKRSDFERLLDESYSGSSASAARRGPSAQDFWGGMPVGVAEPELTHDQVAAGDPQADDGPSEPLPEPWGEDPPPLTAPGPAR
jgi:excisionase family DNA binding protein